MNAFRSLTVSALMLVIAMFAVPGFGAQSQNKTYTLQMCVGTFDQNDACQASQPNPGAASTRIQALVQNTSPIQSNSTINSVDLFVNLNWTIDSIDPAYEESQPGVLYNPDTSQAGHIIIGKLSPIKPGDILHLSFTVTQFSCGDGSWAQSLIWSGSNFGGNTFTLQPDKSVFVSSVSCGSLACNAIPDGFFVQPTGTTCTSTPNDVQCVEGIRAPNNKDGNACGQVQFYVSNLLNNTDSTARTLHFRWPFESNAVFDYIINTLTSNVQVSWIDNPAGSGIPAFVPLSPLPCQVNTFNSAQPYLPTPYGTLALDVNSSKTKLKVNAPASITAPPNFQIVIASSVGDPPEMMQVTNTSNGIWTVTRGFGKTKPTSHTASQLLMSTPLPIIPHSPPFTTSSIAGYQPDNHAHMCYVTLAVPNGGTFSTELIDIGDGWGQSF